MRYEATIDVSNKNNSHTLTIDFIEGFAAGDSLHILDVGCSAGYLGEYLRAQGHNVTGIDITPEAIDQARHYLNQAYCVTVEEFFSTYPETKFDVVIFGDVLEHVINAEEVLQRTKDALTRKGIVIASIPNVAHIAVRAMLLQGRWDYSELGLLDRDHVRFFTSESIDKLFYDSGYEIVGKRSTNLNLETVAELCGMDIDERFVNITKKIVGSDESATVFQYVCMAVPITDSPRIVCMVPEMESALFELRIKSPLQNWAKRYGGSVRYRRLGEHLPDDLIWGDLFVFQRLAGSYTLELIKVLKAHGKVVVFEIDDLLTKLPDFLNHHRISDRAKKDLVDAISKADVVTTTTHRLAAELSVMNTNVVCVPNCVGRILPERALHSELKFPTATLIVASSDAVRVDFLIKPLQEIQSKYANVRLFIIGPIGEALKKTGLEFDHMSILGYADFITALNTLVNPIGLIPLDNSTFSSCKSAIKYFDYSSVEIPTICSNVPPYSDHIHHGQTGLLVKNTTSAWVDAMETLISSTMTRQRLAEAARRYTYETHGIDKSGDAWEKVIRMVNIQRKYTPELINASKISIKHPKDIMWLIRRLFQTSSHKRFWEILRREGLKGIKLRLARW